MRVDVQTGPSHLARDLLNRYMLPKVALGLIAVASLAGVYLTTATHGGSALFAVIRWSHLASLGVLAGGLMWWCFFPGGTDSNPPDGVEKEGAKTFLEEAVRRFTVFGRVAVAVLLLGAPHLVRFHAWAADPRARAVFWVNLAFLLLLLLSYGRFASLKPASRSRGDSHSALLAFLGAAGALTTTAALDGLLTFPGALSAPALRGVHVLAFGLWIGGAVWNIFVSGPAALARPSTGAIVEAANQLERFRKVVRVILPTLFLTGLFQAYPYLGLNLSVLTASPFGRLIALKLGLIAALVGVFITCPMWRACSPIKGICDLEDLRQPAAQPSKRLDNRGRGCAGFVHIQRALGGLEPGETLELLSSDPISWWELPAWLEKHGHELVQREQSGRLWWRSFRFLIQKGEREQRSGSRPGADAAVEGMAKGRPKIESHEVM